MSILYVGRLNVSVLALMNYCQKFLLKIDDEHFRITHWYENNGIGETHKKRNSYSYRKWRKAVIERDKVCMKCGCKNNLEAHHIKPFAKYPELALDLKTE